MQELDDNALLREYVACRSEEAFAALVSRHINKVYSVALRHTGNPHQAEEVTQTVFVLLAEKSSLLGKRVILEGWLYQTARLTARNSVRGEIRRARREQEAQMQTMVNENKSDVWTQIAPLLDAAIARVNEIDRHAVVLRFFYEKSMKEVGAALGTTESAAAVRLHRAMEKLRQFFVKHGVNSTADIIAGAISSHSVQAAPSALAQAVTALAMAKGTASGGATLTLVKGGSMKAITWLKATTFAAILANAFLSREIVATHFNFAGYPDYWMPQSHSTLVWLLVGCGFPLFFHRDRLFG
jgi:RNA polymerase sigma factor (sigma-70 family)